VQLTLVSHYGEKPADFAALIRELQANIAAFFGARFVPYRLEQVHATIVGLEGKRDGGGVCSENFLRLLGEERHFDFAAMLNFLRHDFAGFDVRVGGFRVETDHGFLSQGQPPFARSFSIQGTTAVAMGWPRAASRFPPVLDELRRSLQRFGALRKWAWREGEVDNDFYFVLGQLRSPVPNAERERVQNVVRETLAAIPPLVLRVDRASLAFVAYSDLRLPPETTRAMWIDESSTTPERLEAVYTESVAADVRRL